jgi:hypothetical protein
VEISLFPFTPSFLDAEAQHLLEEHFGAADKLCRHNSQTGDIYIDLAALDGFVQETANGFLASTWASLKPRLPAEVLHVPNSPDDPHVGWDRALRHAGLQPKTAMETALRGFNSTADAWRALGREDNRIANLPPHVFAENFRAIHDRLTARPGLAGDSAGRDEPGAQPAAATDVVGCFAQAGLVWLIVFFVVAIGIIVGLVLSGGTFAAVLAAVVGWVWATAGLWATIGALIDLVVCLCVTLNAGCTFSTEDQ